MASNKFGAKEVMDVVFYDIKTNKPVLFLDTLKTSEIEQTAQEVYARGGKGNSKLVGWEFDKEVMMNITDALLSPRSLELVTGVATKVGAHPIAMRQSTEWDTSGSKPVDKGSHFPLKASGSGEIQLAYTPLETAEKIWVYEASEEGTPGKEKVGSLSGKTLTVSSLANKEVVVYYSFNSDDTAETYTIAADKFGGIYKVVGNTYVRNAETGQDERFQMTLPKVKLKSGFKIGFSADGDPSSFDMNIEILKDSKTPTMVTMTRY